MKVVSLKQGNGKQERLRRTSRLLIQMIGSQTTLCCSITKRKMTWHSTAGRVQERSGINRGITVPKITGKPSNIVPKVTVPKIKGKPTIIVPRINRKISVTKGITQTFLTSKPRAVTLLFRILSKERVDAEVDKRDPYFHRKIMRPLRMQNSNANSTIFLFKGRNSAKWIQEKKKTRDGCSSSFMNPILKPANTTQVHGYLTLSYLSTSSSSSLQTNFTETRSQPPQSIPQWTNQGTPQWKNKCIHPYLDIHRATTNHFSKSIKTTHLQETMVHAWRDPQTSHTRSAALNGNKFIDHQRRNQILQSTSAPELVHPKQPLLPLTNLNETRSWISRFWQ